MARKVTTYLAVMAGIVLFSGLFIVIFANGLQLSCVHGSGDTVTCRITTILLDRYPTSSRVIRAVRDVRMEENCDDGCSYRALLITAGGESVPVNEVFTDEAIPRRQVEALRAFLQGSEPSLEYSQPVQWWVVALIGGMDLVAVLAVAGNFLREVMTGQPLRS